MKVVGETKFVFTLTNMENVNHIVVFMTGQQAFPQSKSDIFVIKNYQFCFGMKKYSTVKVNA